MIPENTIKFLGTAGARFVVMQQLRRSGGIWLNLANTNLLIDPGPGSLIRCLSSKPPLNPRDLEGIILTHRHLDHSNDVNIIIEAMTNGGFDKKGTIIAPSDALDTDPVILHYLRPFVTNIHRLTLNKKYTIGNIQIQPAVAHEHGVETYGLNIQSKKHKISYITDTQYFPNLETHYTGDILIINVVRLTPGNPAIQHLSLTEAEHIIKTNKPKLAILTHFGMTMIRAKPWELAQQLSKRLQTTVIAASDGQTISLDELK